MAPHDGRHPRFAFEQSVVRVPDRLYWKEQIKCQHACPVHTDARGYVRAIAEGNYELAYLIARGPNPLASICGRVCGAPCEVACRRGSIDKPIAIRALKRFVCGLHGPESGLDPATFVSAFTDLVRRHGPAACSDSDELLPLLQSLQSGDILRVENVSVGIVGSGPAGLAAAHDLALLGFDVTLYELEPVLAGMLAVGVPEYRLPRDLIRSEVAVIEALGVKAVTGCEIGKDLSLPDLRARHDRVILAVGAKRSRSLPIPGADAPGVLGGVEFLRDVALGRPTPLGRQVMVVGGGNVAYDVGRTVMRQISSDAARTARRVMDDAVVVLTSLESLDEMPADDVEIIEGDEEGIIRRNSLGPTEILLDDTGHACAVRFQKCLRVFDEEGRFAPLFDAEQTEDIPCDTVLVAIGQTVDLSFVDGHRDGLEVTSRGFLACDADTGQTSAEDLFVAGDLAYGTKLLIHAVASGKAVARAVYQSITGRPIQFADIELHLGLGDYHREPDYEGIPRVHPPTLAAAERVQNQSLEVESAYSPEAARREASRCLDCGVNTIFDGSRCILCGGCVDVCPELCLRIVSLPRLEGNESANAVITPRLHDIPPNQASAILKDETRCIRCAACALRCPVGAITMERFLFEEVPACPIA